MSATTTSEIEQRVADLIRLAAEAEAAGDREAYARALRAAIATIQSGSA